MQKNTSNDSIPESSVALGNVGEPTPVQYYQLESDVPQGTKTEPTPAFIKLTQKEVSKRIKKTATFATYSLNIPLDNQLIITSSIAKVVKTMAETYDREHQDSFFQAYPDLIIRGPEEDEEFTTAYLRTHIKVFARRLAHYYAQYLNFRKYWIASLMNVSILAKLQGEGPTKLFSERCKWGYVNTATNLFSRFPDPIGFTEGMMSLMHLAVGKTNYGSEILAFPMINVDIYGNRGYHSLPVDNLIATAGRDNTEGSSLDYDNNQADSEAMRAKKLIEHMYDTLSEYTDFSKVTVHAQKKDRQWAPFMPRHENGPRMNIVEYDEHGDPQKYQSYFMNSDNFIQAYAAAEAECPWASFAWNNLAYWEKLTCENFPEMQDPNSDIRTFAETQLHIIAPSKSVKDIYNGIYNSKNVAMEELLKLMQLKKDNKVNTATIVRWSPLVGGTTGDARNVYFERNFERYDVFNSNIADMLQKSKEWPDLTPTAFATASKQVTTSDDTPLLPIVINSVPTTGYEMQAIASGTRQLTSLASIIGKTATYFDMASSVSLDPTATSIVAHGVKSEWMRNFVTAGNGLVFDEDPTMVRVAANPVFETNDLFMSGFSLVCFDKNLDTAPSDTSAFYMNEANFSGVTEPAVVTATHIEQSVTIDEANQRMHTANPVYMQKIKMAQVFLGDGIFNHPLINPSIKGCGTFTYETFVGGNESQTPYRNTSIFMTLDRSSAVSFIQKLSNLLVHGSDLNTATIGDGGVQWTNMTPKHIFLMHTDPNFGPVKPVTYQDPIADIVPLDIYEAGSSAPTNDKLRIKMNKEYFSSDVEYSPDDIAMHLLYSSVDSTPKMILPFITSFNLMPCHVDKYGTAHLVSDKAAGDVWCSCSNDYMRSLLTKTVTQFTGMEDTFPFWSYPLLTKVASACEIPTVTETSQVPRQEIAVSPREPFSKNIGRKPSFNDYKAKGGQVRSEGYIAAKALGGSIKSTDAVDSGYAKANTKTSGKIRHGRRHPKSKYSEDKSTGYNDGIAHESSFASSNSSTPNLVDSSTPEQDKAFDKAKSKIRDKAALDAMQA